MDFEILIVDDGSDISDRRYFDEIREAGARVRVIHLEKSLGQTSALKVGFENSRAPIIVTMDGDLQNDPADIPKLVELCGTWDCATGDRTASRAKGDGLYKRLCSRIGNGFRNWITGDSIRDTGCSLRAFRRQCVDGLNLTEGMHRFLPTLMRVHGFSVVEVPVNHRPRAWGRSHYGVWNRLGVGIRDCIQVARLTRQTVRLQAPATSSSF